MKIPVSTQNWLAAAVTRKPLTERHETMVLDECARYVTVTPPTKRDRIELLHLTDLQFGHRAFLRDRFVEFRDWILARPDCYVVLGGDVIDAATMLSVGSAFDNVGRPSEQVQAVVEMLGPLAPRIWGYVGGNHERRTEKTFGECGKLIATLLKVPYSPGVQYVDVWFGKHAPFRISLWHGTGAARTKGAKAQMVHRFMQHGDSQLYLVGHLHDAMVLYDWPEVRSGDCSTHLLKKAGVMSSSFLGYYGTYAEVAGLSPSDTLMARVLLDRDGGWEITLR